MEIISYRLSCLNCNYKQIVEADKSKDLVRVESCRSCGGLKFKCPACGNLIKAKIIRETRN